MFSLVVVKVTLFKSWSMRISPQP